MNKQNLRFLINQKTRRLESLRNKSFLLYTVGDKIEEAKLKKEIKELEKEITT